MKYLIFSIFDDAAKAYLQPIYLPTKGMAIRGFTEASNTPDHDFFKYPDSYTLFELGEFDDGTGEHKMHSSKQPMGSANEFKNPALEQLRQNNGKFLGEAAEKRGIPS